MEPNEYFKELKNDVGIMESEELNRMLNVVNDELIKAYSIGQDTVVERLLFSRKSIAREIQAVHYGVDRYVYKNAIADFIDTVVPENSVKIIELSRYPRIIPEENLQRIKEIKEHDVFDNYCVVFTDLSGESLESPEDKEFKRRNQDPIVFGYYEVKDTSLRSDRFYLITDWEDEYCDLTFDRLIQELPDNSHGKLEITPEYLETLMADIERDVERKQSNKLHYDQPTENRGNLFTRIIDSFKK